jgi:hypothetical protein
MLTTILRAAALLAFIAAPLATAAAEDDTQLVESLSPQVADVVTGGSWSEGKQGGFYRAISLMSGDEKSFGAHVYLQWLAFEEKNPVPKVIKTVAVKEINDQKLQNASIEIEGEEGKDNQVTITVSSYDFDADKDISLFVKGGAPGIYTMVKAPPKGAEPPAKEGAPAKEGTPAKPEAPGKED